MKCARIATPDIVCCATQVSPQGPGPATAQGMQVAAERGTPPPGAQPHDSPIFEGVVVATPYTDCADEVPPDAPPDGCPSGLVDLGLGGRPAHASGVRFAEDVEHVVKIADDVSVDEELDVAAEEALRARVDRMALVRALLFVIIIPIIAFIVIGAVTVWVRNRPGGRIGVLKYPQVPAKPQPPDPPGKPGSSDRSPKKKHGKHQRSSSSSASSCTVEGSAPPKPPVGKPTGRQKQNSEPSLPSVQTGPDSNTAKNTGKKPTGVD